MALISCFNNSSSVSSSFPNKFDVQFQLSRKVFSRIGSPRISFVGNSKEILSGKMRVNCYALPSDIIPPPIDHDFQDSLAGTGVETLADGTVKSFGNDNLALAAIRDGGVVISDLSHFGRIRVSGEDRISFLHNQSTADFENLSEGQGCDTVLVTPTARTIDIAYALVMKDAVILLVSPLTCSSIVSMFNRYIFVNDKVQIQDITKDTCFFTIMGPQSSQLIEDLNLSNLVGRPYGTNHHFSVKGMPVTISAGSIFAEDGFSFLLSPSNAGVVWKALLSLGAIPMGTSAWETLRVLQGRPAPGKELTDEYNVLEAGLWRAISVNKGCYKGQETIARLITYDGIKQKLWGIHLDGPADPGSVITVNGKKVGKLTSYASGIGDPEHAGLGYIKKQWCQPELEVEVGDVFGRLVNAPYLLQRPNLAS